MLGHPETTLSCQILFMVDVWEQQFNNKTLASNMFTQAFNCNISFDMYCIKKIMLYCQFDALLVESRNAATVVLMLSSPEEDVQSKACEAIYKFVDKCE